MDQPLSDYFNEYFRHQFQDVGKYRREIRPALCLFLAAHGSLPLDTLQNYFGWTEEELGAFIRQVAPLFAVSAEAVSPIGSFMNPPLIDWLKNEATAGSYHASVIEGHQMLAKLGWTYYENNVNHPELIPLYFIDFLTWHLRRSKDRSKEGRMMTDFPFLVERGRRGKLSMLYYDFDYLRQEYIEISPLRYCVGWHGRCFRMLLSVVPLESLEQLPAAIIAMKLSTVVWQHQPSSPWDDDEYWMTQSPFDGKYYVFASHAMGGGWPTEPDFIEKDRPPWFDHY
jgi:hypothetical protein